jgi:hypothetical protein
VESAELRNCLHTCGCGTALRALTRLTGCAMVNLAAPNGPRIKRTLGCSLLGYHPRAQSRQSITEREGGAFDGAGGRAHTARLPVQSGFQESARP